jgi:31-O-methyltransferase
VAVTWRRMPDGTELSVVDVGEAALLHREIFGEQSYLWPGFPASTPKVVFDIGANIGLASLFFKRQYPDARIVAVEPGPDTYRALQNNFDRYIADGVTHNVAVAGHTGTARFGYYPRSTAESGLYPDQSGETELAKRLLMQTGFTEAQADQFAVSRHELRYVECATVTLSELIARSGVDTIDLLKIDVEKAELDVLAGLESDDWPRIANLVIEVHDVDDRLAVIGKLLADKGFLVDTTQEGRLADTDMYMLFATRGAGIDDDAEETPR